MAPEPAAHNRVKANIHAALNGDPTAGVTCEAFTDGMTIEIDDDTDYEPDAVVRCGDRLDDAAVAVPDPVIVVEATSPSMRTTDSDELADYFRVASVRHYLIVRADRRQVIHHRRDGERIETRIIGEGSLRLDPPGITVLVEAFYAA